MAEIDYKNIAGQVSEALVAGYPDMEIDQALADAYPELVEYDKHGEYVPGSAYAGFVQGMARLNRPRGDKRYFKNLARGFLEGQTFGVAEKIAALLTATVNDVPYKNAKEMLESESDKFRQTYGNDALASLITGGVASPVAAGIAGLGRNLLMRIPWLGPLLRPQAAEPVKNILRESAMAGPIAAADAGLYAAGTSRSPEEMAERIIPEAGIAGAAGTMLTPPMVGATAAAGRAYRALKGPGKPPPPSSGGEAAPRAGRPDDERGLGIIAQAQEETGASSQTVADELERLRNIDPDLEKQATLMDVGGSQMLPATQGALMYPGQARDLGVKNIAPFVRGQVQRLKKFTAKTLLKAPSVSAFRESVNNKRKAAGKLYDKILNRGSVISPETKTEVDVMGRKTIRTLGEILDPERPTVAAAMREADRLAAETRTILPQPTEDGWHAKYLHFVKMGYDLVLSNFGETGLRGVMRAEALQNQKALLKLMDENISGYKNARNAYAEPVTENRAFNDGFQSMARSTKTLENVPEIIETRVGDLSGHERQAFKAGAARWLELFISEDMDPLALANKARQLSKEGMTNKVRSIFGEDAAGKWGAYMNESAEMFARRTLVNPDIGSQTAPRQQAQEMYRIQPREAAQRMPTSLAGLAEAVDQAGATARLRELERKAAAANAPRLTGTGRENITKTQDDVDRFRRAVIFQQALDDLRVGVIPGLLGPSAGTLRHYGSGMKE